MATSAAGHAEVLQSKPASKSEAKDDLKSLPLPEVEKKLGSSPDGLSQAEARSDWPNTAPTRSRRRRQMRF